MGIERGLAAIVDLIDATIEDIRRRVEGEALVRTHLGDVDVRGHQCAGVIEVGEASRIGGAVLDGLEHRLADGVVVAHARARVAGRDAEAGEQVAVGLADHRCTAILVHR